MRLHRFIGNFDFSQPIAEISDARSIRQITRVLRLGAGCEVILGDGKGKEFVAEIKKIDPGKIYLMVRRENGGVTHAERPIILYSAILKREHFRLVVEKATEIGATEIVPLLTERTIKKRVNRERLAIVSREAAEQSARRFVPTVRSPIAFADALAEIAGGDYAVFFDPAGDRCASASPPGNAAIRIFIGPEGGWTEKERVIAKEKGVHVFNLGARTLRAETAAIVGLFHILNSSQPQNPVQ